jgi:hypothetical protein
MPQAHLIDGQRTDHSRAANPGLNHHRTQSDILVSNISLNNSVYMGGSA